MVSTARELRIEPSRMHPLRARWMDPTVGRFTSMDTFEASPEQFLQQHKYNYAGSDPVNNVDPSGNAFVSYIGQLFVAGIRALLQGISVAGAFIVRQAAYTLVRTQVAVYQAGLRVGVLAAVGAGATLRIAQRVVTQLQDPRLVNWAGQITPNMLRQLAANPNAQRFADLRNAGNVQVIQRLPAMSPNVYLRITLAADETDKIISVGVIRIAQVTNLVNAGSYIRLP